ncbi:hypothetical protein SKAU_G00093850 [Synaphobranchus kaupii]|uniref:Uncharacterized protein n=1 Tax=Synaphobranchus kaupii TaxID=118154 RepID=A0A9Q1FXE4_SYNKA|nr:hypothetical protein SKAU_G00093850 [Synaphobranchus kaupii]
MSVSLEELCAIVNVSYEEARILQPIIDSETDEEEQDVVSVLVDSGADGNFIDADLVSQLHLPSVPLQTPLEALAIIGIPLSRITHVTSPKIYLDPPTPSRT